MIATILSTLAGLGTSVVHALVKGKLERQRRGDVLEASRLRLENTRLQAKTKSKQSLVELDQEIQKTAQQRGVLMQDVFSGVFLTAYVLAHVQRWWPLLLTWNQSDQAIFSTIVAFWFGYRLMQR